MSIDEYANYKRDIEILLNDPKNDEGKVPLKPTYVNVWLTKCKILAKSHTQFSN